MNKWLVFGLFLFVSLLACTDLLAQCSLCTKTASQLGEKPALGMNQGIVYLMGAPFAVMGVIAYRWWKNNKDA